MSNLGASGAPPPPQQGVEDPGVLPEFGPNFVRFIVDRFASVERLMARVLDVVSRRPEEDWRHLGTSNTTAAGNMNAAHGNALILLETAPGQKFTLHRCYVEAVGYSWISPYVGAGQVQICVNDVPWDGGGLDTGQSPGQLPAVFTAGRRLGISAQDGERLTLEIASGPTNTMITARIQGTLESLRHGD